MPTHVKLKCDQCGTSFSRRKAEHTRCLKRGLSKVYCSATCCTIATNRSPNRARSGEGLVAGNRRDEQTPFRWFLKVVRARADKKGPSNLTPEYLSSLWENQRGTCPLTGWDLVLPQSTVGWIDGASPRNASLDRIDPSKGYVEGNVRFIAVMANYARSTFSDDDVINFCRAVTENQLTWETERTSGKQ